MKKIHIIKQFFTLTLVALLINCGGTADLGGDSDSDSDDSSGSSALTSESNQEAMVTAAIEAINNTVSSSTSASASTVATLTTNSAQLAYLGGSGSRGRFRCSDITSATQSFSCDNETGDLERDVTFEDCELEHSSRDAVLNGGFVNTIENGGDGFCNINTTIDFAKMVMGRDDLDAVHNHSIDEDGMVLTFTNTRGHDVTVTKTGERTTTFSDPVDEDEDGVAESVTATIDKEIDRTRQIDGETVHSITVFTTDESFTYEVAAEDEESDPTEETASVDFPVHDLTLDEDTGKISERTIESGNLIVDHNLASIRMVFGVGEEGLTFDDGTTCGPVSGTLTMTGYEINDDDSIGEEIGTGTVTFEDGEVQSASFEGVTLTPKPRPCS